MGKQCWSSLRNVHTAINYFFHKFRTKSTHISHRKNLAEHWDLPNTGIFYSQDIASVSQDSVSDHFCQDLNPNLAFTNNLATFYKMKRLLKLKSIAYLRQYSID
jgi:hypothetical protein